MNGIDQDTVILAAPLVTALVEGAKRAGLPSSLAGPAALVYAVVIVALLADDPYSRESALTAIATGLVAAGLYSQVKHYTQRRTPVIVEDAHAAD